MNLIDVAHYRYSTKEFDDGKTIPPDQFAQIKALLRLSPSSVNSQPWHFLIADSPETRKRMAKGTQGAYSFNEPKVIDASHVILFCAKSWIDEDYLLHLLKKEEKDGRYGESFFKDMMRDGRSMFVKMHKYELKDVQHWMEKQVYLNLGTILLGAGALEIDALPIEGMDAKVLNEEFRLLEKGFTAVAMVAMGYRKETDFNAALPKSRLAEDEIITILS